MQKELIGLKVFALVLASLLWFQTALVSEHKTVVNLPIMLLNNPRDLSIQDQPETIPFIVQGKGLEIMKLLLADVKVSIDASLLRPGQDILSLANYNLNLPDNIDLILVGPVGNEDIRISAETKREKRIPINLSFENNQIKQEFSRKRLQITPEYVAISGPTHEIDAISSINTEELTRRHLGLASFKVELMPPSKNISMDTSEIRVIVSSNQTISRVINNIPLNSDDRDRYFPSRLTIKLSGDRQVLDSLRISSIRAIVSPTPDTQGFHSVSVVVPDGIELLAVTPNKLRLDN